MSSLNQWCSVSNHDAAHHDLLENLARTDDGVVAGDEQQAIIFSELAQIKANVNFQILNH